MADIKTHLRELSVATTIGLLKSGIPFSLNDLYDPTKFFELATKVISSDISSARNLCSTDAFSGELKQIVDNGYRLGRTIYDMPYFMINAGDQITWQGNDTQKDDPIDITVGGYGFSLKEESFILENMGLYKLLNCYTGSHYTKRHIFKDYSFSEFDAWFRVTWAEMLSYLSKHNDEWSYSNPKKKKSGKITLSGNTVVLEYWENNHLAAQARLPVACGYSIFEQNTNGKTREEVFSKFINLALDTNERYNTAKKHCAVVASNALADELNRNLNYTAGLPRFLRIHAKEYYYAKTTISGVEIYKVPSLAAFGHDIIIESIVGSVPHTQANILTTIKNVKTGKKLVLRNECRFSHGQFNTAPEAKMYYEHGGSLQVIYENIMNETTPHPANSSSSPAGLNSASRPTILNKPQSAQHPSPIKPIQTAKSTSIAKAGNLTHKTNSVKTSLVSQVPTPVSPASKVAQYSIGNLSVTSELATNPRGKFRAGVKVHHKFFGEGVVLEVKTEQGVVKIEFSVGIKDLGIDFCISKKLIEFK